MKFSDNPADNCRLVANVIDAATDPSLVEQIVNASNTQRIAVHGIKHASKLSGVRQQGVKPLAPEGGPGSFWSLGWMIFCSDQPTSDDSSWTYDTPFFHYGHSYNPGGPKLMGLAVADAARLADAGIATDLKPDSQSVIREVVPPSALTLVIIEERPGERIERTAIELLAASLANGRLLRPGVISNALITP